MSAESGGDPSPAVVWLYDPADDKSNRALEANTFRNEQVALALKKFKRYRVNVREIDQRELREEYSKNLPAFRFFDPSGTQVSKVAGRKALSLSGFSANMEKTWNLSFESRLKAFSRGMVKILDRLDKFQARKTQHAADQDRLKAKPNPRKRIALAREAAELAEEEKEILADEQALLEGVKIRAAFAPDEVAGAR